MAKPKRMKAYATFDLWMADQSEKHWQLIAALRALVKKSAPKLDETVKWGNGCYVDEKSPIIYLYAGYEDHVQLGFFAGVELDDPKGRLEGNGKFIKHVKIRSSKDIDRVYFAKLIRSAIKLGR